MSNRIPELRPEDDEFDDEEFTELRHVKAENERLYFYPLPRYHEDNRFDPRARGEMAAVLPNSDDYETKFKKISTPGWYAVELRRGSKIADSWALEIRPDVRRIAPDAMPSPVVASAPQSPGLGAEDIAVIVDRALARQQESFNQVLGAIREEMQTTTEDRTPPRQLTQTEQLRETIKLVKELQPAATSSSQETPDPFDNFMRMFDRITEMSERVNPAGNDPTAQNVHRAMNLIDKGLSMVPTAISRWRGKGSEQGNGNGQSIEITNEMLKPYEQIISVIVEDITADAPTTRAVAAVESFSRNNTEHGAQLSMVFALSPIDLVNMLSEETGALYLKKLPHSIAWIENLITELKENAAPEQ
ncbi:MAG: hypothetical protein WCD76_22365 [Pyrinomonadaceae bacterium]